MPCRKRTSGPSPATVTAIRGAGPTNTVSRLFRLRARDFHRAAAAFAIGLDEVAEFFGGAADDLVALVDELLLAKLGLIEKPFRVLIDPGRGFARRAGRKKKPEPGMRLDFGIAELGEGRHLRQQGRAPGAADGG